MSKVVNQFVDEGVFAASVYSDFGAKQLLRVNYQVDSWLCKQAFMRGRQLKGVFSGLSISGVSDDPSHKDSVQWELRFGDVLDARFGWLSPMNALDNALLHVKRLFKDIGNDVGPRVFTTANYIQIEVSDGKRGWVSDGLFPKGVQRKRGVRLGDCVVSGVAEDFMYTDTRKDAVAGFDAAREWAKFRTMAVSSSGYVIDKLKAEQKAVFGGGIDAGNLIRSRIEAAVPLMLNFLPDTRLRSGAGSLRSYYEPGVLEGELALGLEKGIIPQYGGRTDSPIYIIKGNPVNIISVPGRDAYDANFSFDVSLVGGRGGDDKVSRRIIQNQLEKYFSVDVISPSKMRIGFYVPNAHKVGEKIVGGSDTTFLQLQANALVDSLGHVSNSLKSWDNEQMPVLKKGYDAMVETGKEVHFGRLEQSLLNCPNFVKPRGR